MKTKPKIKQLFASKFVRCRLAIEADGSVDVLIENRKLKAWRYLPMNDGGGPLLRLIKALAGHSDHIETALIFAFWRAHDPRGAA